MLPPEVGEHGREGVGADEQPADHRRGAHGEIDAFAQTLPCHRAVDKGKEDTAQCTDRCRLCRGGETEKDRPEHRKDQESQRHERGDDHHHQLAHRHIRHLIRRGLWCRRWLQQRPPDDIDQIQPHQRQPRQQRRRIKAHDRHIGRRRIDDQHDRRRDQDAQCTARTDDARRKGRVIARFQHRRQRQQAHQGHNRAHDPCRRGKQRAGDQRRNPHRSGDILGRDVQRGEQTVHDVGAFDDIAHEQEQGHGRQHLVRHHGKGLVHEEVKYSVVIESLYPTRPLFPLSGGFIQPVKTAPHAARIEIGIVAKADAHGHQGKGDREAQKNKDDEQPKHHQGDLRIGHVIWSFSAMLAFWIKRSSVSKTSSSASSQ